jgi:predicted nucleic acid-binding protein
VIVDTNALSAMADAEPGIEEKVSKARQLAIPVIVLGEYWFGISQSRQRTEYERWMNNSLPSCRILEITAETAAKYAEIRSEVKRSGTPIPTNDAWIAALCRQHSLPVLSKDRHFDAIKGVFRIEW